MKTRKTLPLGSGSVRIPERRLNSYRRVVFGDLLAIASDDLKKSIHKILG